MPAKAVDADILRIVERDEATAGQTSSFKSRKFTRNGFRVADRADRVHVQRLRDVKLPVVVLPSNVSQ